MMGFDCESFDRVLDKFTPMFWGHTPFDESGFIVEFEYITGRKREVEPADCLGLVLVWTRTRGPLNVLQLVFGLTYTNLTVYLRFGFRLIVETFHDEIHWHEYRSHRLRQSMSIWPPLVHGIHCWMTAGQQWMG